MMTEIRTTACACLVGLALTALTANASPSMHRSVHRPGNLGVEALGGGAPVEDFVTGGGWIDGTPSGERANFGLKAGFDGVSFFGHLNYIDKDEGMHVKAESITAYTAIDATTRRILGTARIDGESGFTFELIVSDVDEPGRPDEFELTLSNGYTASDTLQGGGNIQLHD